MSPSSFFATLDQIGWSRPGLAKHLGCPLVVVQRWAHGLETVPPEVAAWLERLASAIAAHPPPINWRKPRVRRLAADKVRSASQPNGV